MMKVFAGLLGPALVAGLLGASPLPVAPSGSCSQDTFTIDGSSVAVEICPHAGAHDAAVVLGETLTVKGETPLLRDLPLDVTSAHETAHAIDDISLAKLGLARTLHIAVAYRSGNVHLEHALLVPGAISLK